MIKFHHVLATATVLSVLALAGCGDTTLHEAGEYKGSNDPDATTEAADARAETLRQRALLAHTDR